MNWTDIFIGITDKEDGKQARVSQRASPICIQMDWKQKSSVKRFPNTKIQQP